jgi:hypothetical protein
MSPIHFYLTFNPYLNTDYEGSYTQAHEFYDLLKDLVQKDKNATIFWGKMIGKDRESKLDLTVFEKVIQSNSEQGLSTHLYITDFQNLWVGRVNAITDTLPKKGNTLPFYEGKKVEIWFEISDFCLLEHNHEETANKISELYIDNNHHDLKINGLSPFTTAIKYPCFIQDLAEEQYFDALDTNEVSHLVLKHNPSINSTTSQQVLRCLHAYAFPESLYKKIPYAAKMEIETAEQDMLEQRHHNPGRIAFGYLKALEIIMNDLIIHHIKRKGFGGDFYVDNTSMPPKLFLQESKDHLIPLKQFPKNFSLNQLIYFMERCHNQNHLSFKKAFSEHKQFVRFVTSDLQQIIKDNQLINIRGILAHNNSAAISLSDAMAVRNLILGVGCKGLIHLAYQTFYPEFRKMIQIEEDYSKSGDKDYQKSAKLKLVG